MRIEFAASLLALLPCATAHAQVTTRASVSSAAVEGDSHSDDPVISPDGRYVAFYSAAGNLVAGDGNGATDVFVHDRQTGVTERVSIDPAGASGSSSSMGAAISADGLRVAFMSVAANLVAGDTNAVSDVFVRDRHSGTTTRVSVSSTGVQGDFESTFPAISADGRWVAFTSNATNLVAGDTNGGMDVFVHDLQTGATELVSLDLSGGPASFPSRYPSISADGRYVAFQSSATDLVPGDTNGYDDVFVRDCLGAATERVSVGPAGGQADSGSGKASISSDGRFVAFASTATNLVPGDANGQVDVFVHDRQSGTTELVSVSTAGAQAASGSSQPSISADGLHVAFESSAINLVPQDTNDAPDVFVRDRRSGVTERVSVGTSGTQGDSGSLHPAISGDGRIVAFDSHAAALVSGDTNGTMDVFVHDRASGFSSFCEPGLAGVAACPCSNPAAGPGRGCDNSSATGGAILSASGLALLSADSLVLATKGEKPTAPSIVLQGQVALASGAVFGQGVRCAAGTVVRLYLEIANGGSIQAPDFAAGDPSVSARSAALGDVIAPGQDRYYFVYYRDPIVLGGCPAASTFNATQSGRVAWAP